MEEEQKKEESVSLKEMDLYVVTSEVNYRPILRVSHSLVSDKYMVVRAAVNDKSVKSTFHHVTRFAEANFTLSVLVIIPLQLKIHSHRLS